MPYSTVAGGPGASPYQGVGSLLQFDLAWLDIFGNRVLGEFDNPVPPAGALANKAPQITGYTDRLLGVGQWPAVSHAYRVTAPQEEGPTLTFRLHFAADGYAAAATAARGTGPDAATAGQQKLQQAIRAYSQIVQQLADPAGIETTLSSTIVPGTAWTIPNVDQGKKSGLSLWADTILAYLQALLNGTQDPPVPTDFSYAAVLDPAELNDGQIFQLTATLTLARKPSMVAGALRTASSVTQAATQIAPWTGPVDTTGAGDQRSLTAFATDFASAFAGMSGFELRIATGSDRNVFAGGANRPLWVVQLGKKPGTDAISFAIEDAGAPTVYAPRPISNVLQSKAQTPLIPYASGVPFDPKTPRTFASFAAIDLDNWMRTTLAAVDALLTPRYVVPADILRKNIQTVKNDDGWPDALQSLLDAKENLAKALKKAMIPVFNGPTPSQQRLDDVQEAFYQGMLGTLGQFYAVTAGVQFTADVAAAVQPQPSSVAVPRVFGDVSLLAPAVSVRATKGGTSVTSEKSVTVSSPKLDLRFANKAEGVAPPSPYLSSLVTVASGDAKYVTLHLGYAGRYIEHEIGQLPGIEGYQPSSWLSFVRIGDDDDVAPFQAELGQFDVPVVLRAFPEMPSLLSQDSVLGSASPCYQSPPPAPVAPVKEMLAVSTCSKPGSYNPLSAVTRWAYAFKYALQVHEQQDVVHGRIAFNIQDPGTLLRSDVAGDRDLFDNLAQFNQTYPAVLKDLDTALLPIDVGTTGPGHEQVLRTAQYALDAASKMIQMVADTADLAGALGAGNDSDGIAFTIFEDAVDMPVEEGTGGDSVEALRVTIGLSDALPPRVGAPFIEIAGYACRRVASGSDPLVTSFVFVDDEGDYLPASVGRNIPGRSFVLPDLDILERQDAETTIFLTRNAGLVPGKVIADPFVYRTPDIAFESPLHPTLVAGDDGHGIDLATIYSTGPGAPVTRSLECQLSLFYEALFAFAGTDDVTMQLTLYYEYSLNDALIPIRLPVFLMPPTKTKIREKGQGVPLPDLIERQTAAWNDWFGRHTPETRAGRLTLELIVMSDLTARPMPILKLSGLYLQVENIG